MTKFGYCVRQHYMEAEFLEKMTKYREYMILNVEHDSYNWLNTECEDMQIQTKFELKTKEALQRPKGELGC